MNILYLHTHDLGTCLSPYGFNVATPGAQKLAERGLTFRQAFCAAPSCSPSRAALLTGRYPHCNGMFGLTHTQGWHLNDYEQHLTNYLGSHGFETALAGINHIAWMPPPEGRRLDLLRYEHYLSISEAEGGRGMETHEGVEWFLSHRDPDRPFFLSAGFFEPHRFNGGDGRSFIKDQQTESDDIDGRFEAPFGHWPDNATTRREMANFRRGVNVADEHFGRVIDALERHNLTDDTLIILTTDHGPGAPDMKCTLSDRGTRVALIVAGAGVGARGEVCDSLVSQIDLYPTLCDLTGVPRPDWLQGVSLAPILADSSAKVRDEVFTEQNYHGTYRPMRAIRTERYKLLRRYRTDARVGVDGGPVDRMFREAGWEELEQPAEALTDLMFDPQEQNNRIDDPKLAAVAADLRARLDSWLVATGDPIVDDAIPCPPQGATDRAECA